MANFKVTVLMATYNRAGMVGRAIESFLAQDYSNSTLIILDDASTDNTVSVLKQYENNPRITIHYGTTNKLPPNNWNWLWEQVSPDTDLICQLHDDDELTQSSLSDRVAIFERNPTAQVVYGGVVTQNLTKTDGAFFPGQSVDVDRIWREEYINFVTLMYRPNLPFRFDPELRYYFDWLFKIRCLTECETWYTPVPVMKYTVHPGQETNKCRRENMNEPDEKLMRIKLKELYGYDHR